MDHILYLCRSGGNPPSTAKKEIVIIRQNVIRAATNYEKIPLLKTMFCLLGSNCRLAVDPTAKIKENV